MSNDFWLKKWENGEIGFHHHKTNPLLEKHYELLSLNEKSNIFVPLCGKSLDIMFFLSKGHKVIGCELSPLAINELFIHLKIKPKVEEYENFKTHSCDDIVIYEGDIFDLKKEHLGEVHAIYDRAALVALQENVRVKYTKHLQELTDKAKQLILTCSYEQELHQRTPYSVPKEEIFAHYKENYAIEQLESREIKGGMKGICPAYDEVWLLS